VNYNIWLFICPANMMNFNPLEFDGVNRDNKKIPHRLQPMGDKIEQLTQSG